MARFLGTKESNGMVVSLIDEYKKLAKLFELSHNEKKPIKPTSLASANGKIGGHYRRFSTEITVVHLVDFIKNNQVDATAHAVKNICKMAGVKTVSFGRMCSEFSSHGREADNKTNMNEVFKLEEQKLVQLKKDIEDEKKELRDNFKQQKKAIFTLLKITKSYKNQK